jgi:hypothetical protein
LSVGPNASFINKGTVSTGTALTGQGTFTQGTGVGCSTYGKCWTYSIR